MQDEKVDISYSALWKSIIRPPRDEYSEDQLGDNIFIFRDKTYMRKDYKILNKQGNLIRASFIEPDDESRVLIKN
jgi:hypothetical protein